MVKSRMALSAALMALLDEKPLDQISVREITARAGIGYATFFRHFPSIDDLLRESAADAVAALLARALPMLFGDNPRAASLALCQHVDAHRAYWTALLTRGGGAILREQFAAQAGAVAEGGPEIQNGLPRDLGVYFGVRGAVDILAWWLLRREDYSAEQVAAFLDRLVITPTVLTYDIDGS